MLYLELGYDELKMLGCADSAAMARQQAFLGKIYFAQNLMSITSLAAFLLLKILLEV